MFKKMRENSVSSGTSDLSNGVIKIQDKEIPFVCFLQKCGLKAIINIMIEEWKLQVPNIVIRIVSDNSYVNNWSEERQKTFIKGLVKASNSTSMWIITNGLNIGVVKQIGEEFEANYQKQHADMCYARLRLKHFVKKTPLIGLCHYNFLTYHEKFSDLEKVMCVENSGNKPEEHLFDLNSYHTHFLIMKDKTSNRKKINSFLLNLERALYKVLPQEAENNIEKHLNSTLPVPALAIVIQGDTQCINYVLAHLKLKLPVIVIRGSGGLADILAYTYYEVYRSFQKLKDVEYVENVLKQNLSNKITAIFPSLKDNKISHSSLCNKILDCFNFYETPELKYITVFSDEDLTTSEDLPKYLLKTILKIQESTASNSFDHFNRDLKLTIDWNCPDLSSTQVFYKDPSFRVNHDIFEQTLLKDDREEFISVFLDNGFEVHRYLNSSRLIGLFEYVLKEDFFREVCWEGVLGYRKVISLDEYFIDTDLNWIIETLIGIPIYISSHEINDYALGIYEADCPRALASIIAERKALIVLIIWALISDRRKLSVHLWRHIDQPIMMALVCCLILNRIQAYINEEAKQEEIKSQSKQFADKALGVFDLVYNDIPSKAYDSLSVKIDEWKGHSVIDMAVVSQNKDFVSHPCCQKWLTNTFMDKIKLRDLSWGIMTIPKYIKVILCALLIFPMYLWVRFKEASLHEFIGAEEWEMKELLSDSQLQELETKGESDKSHMLKYHYPPLWKMIYWMWSAPITKFWVSHIFYISYLGMFSLAVIWPSCGNPTLDLAVCIWTSLIAFDSSYRLYALQRAFPNTKLFAMFLEVLYMVLFVLFYFALRIKPWKDPYGGKVLGCIGLLWFFYRMIFIYLPISSTLGPLLYRVNYMVSIDFVNFMKLTVLIIIANAIAMQAVLYPDYPLIPEMVRKSFHKAFMSFFATPVDELRGSEPNCEKWVQKPNDGICRASDYIDAKCSSGVGLSSYLIVFQYIILLKMILLPILFALFSNTGAKFGGESDTLWKFQRYNLIIKFSVSLCLPPPLNIFSLIWILCKGIQNFFRSICCLKVFEKMKGMKSKPHQDHLPQYESNYWKQLAKKYFEKQKYENAVNEYNETEIDIISTLVDDVNQNEEMIYRIRSQIAQLEADINYTYAHLETLKYHERKENEENISFILHSLSRDSPYPRTKVHRFPVPDKYVPWEVLWLHYEPTLYTQPMKRFPKLLQPYVDEDILTMQLEGVDKSQIPNYLWNMDTVDSIGVYRNRNSWMIDRKGKPLIYKLDIDGLPKNPMGRTGLRGKGALPRWGPNHNVFIVITRWQRKISKEFEKSILGTSDLLEYVETSYMTKDEVSLPGGFAWSESRYGMVQTVFVKDPSDPSIWESSNDMIEFFKRYATRSEELEQKADDFKCDKIYCGYMDDQLNTDQAWKEVELWHVHYNNWSNLGRMFKRNVKWKVLTEEAFIRLQDGQTILLQNAVRSFQTQVSKYGLV